MSTTRTGWCTTPKGDPIPIGDVWHQKTDVLYALDTTHPGAQQYMRDTYRTLVREWGVRFIKLDFMDTSGDRGLPLPPQHQQRSKPNALASRSSATPWATM